MFVIVIVGAIVGAVVGAAMDDGEALPLVS